MRTSHLLVAVALAAVVPTSGALAQAQAYPPDGYSPLLFDSADTKYVFRLNGTPWICRGDTFCKPIKIDGVADKDAAQATIESLGSAGPRYYLSSRQANSEKGKDIALSCTETDCSELPLTRDAELYLSAMGSGRNDGRVVAWLRDKSGAVLSCAQPEEGVSDQLACEKTKIVLSDFPATAAAPATPAPAPAP